MASIAPLKGLNTAVKHVVEADHLRNLDDLPGARRELRSAIKAATSSRDLRESGHAATGVGDIRDAIKLMKSPDRGGDPMKASSTALAGMRMLEVARLPFRGLGTR